MGKVVTSAGLNEFVSSGKYDEVKDDPRPGVQTQKKAEDAPPLEVKAEKPAVDVGEKPKESSAEVPFDEVYPDIDQESREELTKLDLHPKSLRYDKLMRRKHAEMKAAKEAADEAERFAENQFNARRMAEQKLAEAEALLKSRAPAVEPKPESVRPKNTDPKYLDGQTFKQAEYEDDLLRWNRGQAIAEFTVQQESARRAVEAAEAERLAKERIDKARKAHPDFQKVWEEMPNTFTHNQVIEYLTASEHIGEVAYHMAKHPDFVEHINKLHPLKAIAEIGKLEATFEKPAVAAPKVEAPAPAPQTISAAPPPISPLNTSGSGTVNVDPSKMNFRELRAWERSRQKRR